MATQTKKNLQYELWKDENGYSFFLQSNESAKSLLLPGATLIWSVEAGSWEEANRKKNAYLGWEPYKPMK